MISASVIHWTLTVAVWIGVVVGCLLWSHWLITTLVLGRRKPLLEADAKARPFWEWTDFLVMLGVFIIVYVLAAGFLASGSQRNDTETPDVAITAVESVEDVTQSPSETPRGRGAIVEVDILEDANAKRESMIRGIQCHTIANFVAVLIALTWLRTSYNRPLNEFGLGLTGHDCKVGCVAAIWILAPVLLISSLVSWLVPYEHVLLDTMASDPSWNSFLLVMVSAVFVTPVAEELAFRMLLQGGLQHLVNKRPETVGADGPDDESSRSESFVQWVPILIASSVFALLHLGQGAAPIPLFVFSVGLGYVYRQTGRLAVPILIHMILNLCTLCVEYSRISAGL